MSIMCLLAIGTNDCITYNNAVTKNKIPSLFLYLKKYFKTGDFLLPL